jgi:uncharacterized protein (TIGR03067 family)
MRRCTLTAVAVGLLLIGLNSLNATQEGKDDLAKQELKKLQGTWTMAGLEKDGEKLPEEKLKEAMWKVKMKGTSFVVTIGAKTIAEGTFTIDASKNPKRLDAEVTSKGKTEKTIGIYDLDGDTLRVCFVPEGKERPTDFKTKAGSDRILETLRREK